MYVRTVDGVTALANEVPGNVQNEYPGRDNYSRCVFIGDWARLRIGKTAVDPLEEAPRVGQHPHVGRERVRGSCCERGQS